MFGATGSKRVELTGQHPREALFIEAFLDEEVVEFELVDAEHVELVAVVDLVHDLMVDELDYLVDQVPEQLFLVVSAYMPELRLQMRIKSQPQ